MNKLQLEFLVCKVEENMVEEEKCGADLEFDSDQTDDAVSEKVFQPFTTPISLNIETVIKNEQTFEKLESHDKLDSEIKHKVEMNPLMAREFTWHTEGCIT